MATLLDELGFIYDVPLYQWEEVIMPALKTFQQERGHCIVERPFKVPSGYPWPEAAWGMPLGQIVNGIRRGGGYPRAAQYEERLDSLGFAWDRDLATWNELIMPALQTYVAEFGTSKMMQRFAVPACDPWPRQTWGFTLGKRIYHLRYYGYYFAIVGRDVDRLEKLGYSFELRLQAWNKYVEPLLDTYAAVFGSRKVPDDFIFPSEAPWPEKMWGVHLGVFVARNSQYLKKS